MKKLFNVLIAIALLALIAGLAACNNGGDTHDTDTTASHEHQLVKVNGRESSCAESGWITYWSCTECDKLFSDRYADNEISLEDTKTAPKTHKLTKYDAKAATCLEAGNIEYYVCSKCNKYYADAKAKTEIASDSVTLSIVDHDYSVRCEDSVSYWIGCSMCNGIQPDSQKPLDPSAPTLPNLDVVFTRKIAVGQRCMLDIPGSEEYTAYVWNTSKLKIEEYFDYGFTRGVCVCGLSSGEVMVSAIGKNGETLINYKFTVVEDEPTYLGEGDLVKKLDVANINATVYYDDTLVTYTVKTSASVDRLEFTQIASTSSIGEYGYCYETLILVEERSLSDPSEMLVLDTLVINKDTLTNKLVSKAYGVRYSTTRTVNGNEATWVIKWDLGKTAVKYVRINAYDSSTGAKQTSYAHLNINYPKFGGTDKDFETLLDMLIKSNENAIIFRSTKPYTLEGQSMEYFSSQQSRICGVQSDFNECFINTTIYGGNSVLYIPPFGISTPVTLGSDVSFIKEILNGKKILAQNGAVEEATMAFHYPITDELRAVWAYKHGYEIDAEKFPYAYDILKKASAVIDEIIKDGMTDFEKERAIYTWLYEYGDAVNKGKIKLVTPPADLSLYYSSKTSYAIFNNYGGDCMAFSGAFYTLCNMVGVDCVTVSLLTGGGGPTDLKTVDHRANIVKLDGECYFVEAFWSWQKTSDADGTYRYLNFNSAEAAKIYAWSLPENGGPRNFNYSKYLVDAQTGELLKK